MTEETRNDEHLRRLRSAVGDALGGRSIDELREIAREEAEEQAFGGRV